MRGDEALLEFAGLMRRLRVECPWKAAQTHRSLSRHLLEEAYETLEAIDSGDESGDWTHLREELGDLLLQVYFHAVVAEQSGAFTLGDVAGDIAAKMVRRNPHVFADAGADAGTDDLDPAAVNELWEAAKATEKRRGAVTDGIPAALPALLYADKVLDRLERAGTPVAPPEPDAGIGEALLAVVARARAEGVDPEQALRDAVRRRLP
ncbi:MazG family protein [Nocardioides houyundeii]|uniref:MazG family protein n=1 Tax=Nocardioides houyundeii TaxID=2045452 RepID=UPI001F5358FD|nr:MazG family protein [Nocardioides houyundeii]